MSTAARVRPRRAIGRVCTVALLLALVGTACFLPFAGRFLVREDPLEPADVIFVLAGGRVERWLEGGDLFRERHAALIVLSPGRIEKAEMELRAKGVRFPTEAELARDTLLQLGVPADAVRILPGSVDNTAHEAEALHQLLRSTTAGASQWQRIIVVTARYHTRRTGFAFRREFRDSAVRILVRGTRYDEAEPNRWWRHRADIRFVTSELQKLLLYGFGLGS
jgi:uncharacterized SAM-binding protein YcdF (DUF218 family)